MTNFTTIADVIEVPLKQDVLGIGISKTSYADVARLCVEWARRRQREAVTEAQYICVTSVHGVITARADSELRGIINGADIATPDGMPVVWAIRSLGHKAQQRVYGPTLMLEICRQSAAAGLRIFLYGGHEETIAALKANLMALVPDLQIAGSYVPPFRPLTPDEDRDVQKQVRQTGADIIFVGISTPKQEKWMHAHRFIFPGITMVGVGAAFDFHAGRTKQAPAWMQRNGLEWFFRLIVEPGRLWRRYLLVTPLFIPLFAMQKWRSGRQAGSAAQ